jgi:hypothetical protein
MIENVSGYHMVVYICRSMFYDLQKNGFGNTKLSASTELDME